MKILSDSGCKLVIKLGHQPLKPKKNKQFIWLNNCQFFWLNFFPFIYTLFVSILVFFYLIQNLGDPEWSCFSIRFDLKNKKLKIWWKIRWKSWTQLEKFEIIRSMHLMRKEGRKKETDDIPGMMMRITVEKKKKTPPRFWCW